MPEAGGIIIRVSSLSRDYREELCRRLEKALNSPEIRFLHMHNKNSNAEEVKYVANSLPADRRGFLLNPKGFKIILGDAIQNYNLLISLVVSSFSTLPLVASMSTDITVISAVTNPIVHTI